jgi:hypothetical protein
LALACHQQQNLNVLFARDDHIIRWDFSDCKAIVPFRANLVARRPAAKNHCSDPQQLATGNLCDFMTECVILLRRALQVAALKNFFKNVLTVCLHFSDTLVPGPRNSNKTAGDWLILRRAPSL